MSRGAPPSRPQPTCCSRRSMSPAWMTMGPLTAYSTAFTCGFSVSMVRLFSLIRAAWPVSALTSAEPSRWEPRCNDRRGRTFCQTAAEPERRMADRHWFMFTVRIRSFLSRGRTEQPWNTSFDDSMEAGHFYFSIKLYWPRHVNKQRPPPEQRRCQVYN